MPEDVLCNLSLADLRLSLWARCWLRLAGISTVRDLVSRTSDDLRKMWGIGEGTLSEIWETLGAHGLELGMEPPTSN